MTGSNSSLDPVLLNDTFDEITTTADPSIRNNPANDHQTDILNEVATSTTTESTTATTESTTTTPAPEPPPESSGDVVDQVNGFFDNVGDEAKPVADFVGEQTKPVEDFAKDIFGRKKREDTVKISSP